VLLLLLFTHVLSHVLFSTTPVSGGSSVSL
jgi:hypothetical protein